MCVLATALKRIGELKVDLPNWRTLYCVADQEMHVKSRKLLEFQVETNKAWE